VSRNVFGSERRAHVVKRPAEIEEAVEAQYGRPPAAVPLEDVVAEPVRDDRP
jgi:hypothetical protein